MQNRDLWTVGRSFRFRRLMAQERHNALCFGAVFLASIGLGLRGMFLDLERGVEGPDCDP